MHQLYRFRLLSNLRVLLVVALAAVAEGVAAGPPRPAPRLDLHGDPLPPGAVVRLGTVRLRNIQRGHILPDGKRLAAYGHGWVHLFDVATGKEAPGFPKKGKKWVRIAVSPRGTLLAALDCEAKTVVVWELPSGKECRRLEMPEVERYFDTYDLVFSSDGKVLMAANRQVACSWDLGSGKRIRHFKVTHKERTSDALLCCAANQRVLITPARSSGPSRGLFTTFSPGGKYLAVGETEKPITVWDVAAGKVLHRLELTGARYELSSAAFSKDGKILVIGSGLNGGVSLWDVATGKQLRCLPDKLECITSVAISPDGKQVAAAGVSRLLIQLPMECALYLWDLGAKDRAPRILKEPGVRWVQYSPDGKTLALGYSCESVCLIDRKSGKEIAPRNAHRDSISSLAYSPDGKRLATASSDRSVRVWEAATGRPLLTLMHTNRASVVAFSPCGHWLASGDGDGTAVLWDAATGAKKRTLKHEGWVSAVAFSPDGRHLAINPGWGPLWDLATGKAKAQLRDPKWSYDHTVFSPDWKFLADYRQDSFLADYRRDSVQLRERAIGRVVWKFEARREKRVLAFSPDGRALASVTKDKLIVWEVATCRERAAFPITLFGEPSSLVFSPDGTLLAFCDGYPSWGRQVRLWDLATGKELTGVAPEAERVSAVAFSPDGRHLATASDDTTVLIWDLSRHRRR